MCHNVALNSTLSVAALSIPLLQWHDRLRLVVTPLLRTYPNVGPVNIEVTKFGRLPENRFVAACEDCAFGKCDDCEAEETDARPWRLRRRSPDSGTDHAQIDRVSLCVTAQAANNCATVFTEVIAPEDEIVEHWSPRLACRMTSVVIVTDLAVSRSPTGTRNSRTATGLRSRMKTFCG